VGRCPSVSAWRSSCSRDGGRGRHQLGLEGFTAQERGSSARSPALTGGQAFGLNVVVASRARTGWRSRRSRRIHRQHLRPTGHSSPGGRSSRQRAADRLWSRPGPPASATAARASRPTWRGRAASGVFDGAPHDCAVWERERLPERAALSRPRHRRGVGATTIVPPGWRARSTSTANLRFERRRRHDRSDHARGAARDVRVDRAQMRVTLVAHGVSVHLYEAKLLVRPSMDGHAQIVRHVQRARIIRSTSCRSAGR